MRWTLAPARNAAFSLASSASHATTWASAPARSASTMTFPGSGTNIFLMFGSLNSFPDIKSGDWEEDNLGDAMFMGDVLGFVGAVE